jgi:hypothetical protein
LLSVDFGLNTAVLDFGAAHRALLGLHGFSLPIECLLNSGAGSNLRFSCRPTSPVEEWPLFLRPLREKRPQTPPRRAKFRGRVEMELAWRVGYPAGDRWPVTPRN